MRRMFVVLIVAALLVAALVTPALAAGNGSGGNPGRGKALAGQVFGLVGVVAEVDITGQTVTVTVWSGSTLVKPYIGENVVLKVTDATKIRQSGDPEGMFLALDEVTVGATISAGGLFEAATATFTAGHLTLNVPDCIIP